MIEQVLRTMKRYGMTKAGEPVWVAVSGGVDSMVLLHVLRTLYHPCKVVHVDHGLRGLESDTDRAFVEHACANYGIQCTSVQVDVAARRAVHEESVQMAARELRYGVLRKCIEEGPAVMALAHHRDDALETFFMNLLRGAGQHGLSSIPPKAGPFIRPFIDVDRTEILAYATRHRITYREDQSNRDPHYLRSRVRHELIPLMEDLRPGARRTITRSIEWSRELNSSSEERVARIRNEVINEADGTRRIAFDTVHRDGTPMLALSAFLSEVMPHPERIVDILRAVDDGAVGARFPLGVVDVVIDRGHVVLSPASLDRGPWVIGSPADVSITAPVSIAVVAPHEVDLSLGPGVAWFDGSALKFPLELRTWRAGDRLQPLGMGGGGKLVSDLLTDLKVPADRKPHALVLVSDGSIAWLCGHRLGEGFQATAKSDQVIKVCLESAF